MTELPEPPTPAEADLRGMQYMQLYGDRLFASTTWTLASFEARCAALRLWWHAFAHQVPAGSLPNDDRLLAEYAGYGVALKAWAKVRQQAMRGWSLCKDGRLYHKVVAELVAEAWAGRQKFDELRAKWRAKKHRGKAASSPGNGPDFSGASPGKAGEVSETSPGKSLLRERESERDKPLPLKNSRGSSPGGWRRAGAAAAPPGAPETPFGVLTEHIPAGFRQAVSSDEYLEYLREKHGDPKIDLSDIRVSRWRHVPVGFKRKAS